MINYDKITRGRIALSVILLSAPAIYLSIAKGDGIVSLLKSIAGFVFMVILTFGIVSALFIVLYALVTGLAIILFGKKVFDKSEGLHFESLYSLSLVSFAIGYIGVCLYMFGVRIHF